MPLPLLYIAASGKVLVEFDHSVHHWPAMTLKEGDYIGDMALVNELNWAKSVSSVLPPSLPLSFPPQERSFVKGAKMTIHIIVVKWLH